MKLIKATFLGLGFALLSLLATSEAVAFRPETFWTLAVPVYEFSDPVTQTSTLTNVELIYSLSTPSATPVTWLVGYDSLRSATSSAYFKRLLAKNDSQEVGLRLEVDPTWLKAALTQENRTGFELPSNFLLVGYEQTAREKLIDTAMAEYFSVFGRYPKTVAAAYLDAFSLELAASRYSVQTAVITPNNRVQYINAYQPEERASPHQPVYFPSKTNSLVPSNSQDNRINLALTFLNPAIPGQTNLPLTNMSPEDLAEYLTYWSQKELNEFTQLSLGSDNRLSPAVTRTVYRTLFEQIGLQKDRLTLTPVSLETFGDWYLARFPHNSPAFYFATQNNSSIAYFNPFYRLRLEADGSQSQLAEVVWYQAESEPYWFQPFSGSELKLPIYNQAVGQTLELDLTQVEPLFEYWTTTLQTDTGMLRLEPKSIVSSWPLDWVDPEFVEFEQKGDLFVYRQNPVTPLSNQIAPATAFLLVLLFVLFLAHSPWKKKRG
jgi:hypothetical protein